MKAFITHVFFFAIGAVFMTTASAAFAQESPAASGEVKEMRETVEDHIQKAMDDQTGAESQEIMKEDENLHEQMQALVKDAGEEEQKHFYMAYTTYNLVSASKMVAQDVKKAIDACSEKNPQMKDKLQARYNAWDQDVGAVIKEAGAQVDNMVAAQDYAKPAEIRKVFKSLDARRTKTESQITKIPVTTPEACQFLHDKMDETQASLTNLLRSALITAPQQETQGAQPEAPAEKVE